MIAIETKEATVTKLDNGGFQVTRSGLAPDGVFYISHVSTYDVDGVLIEVVSKPDPVLNAIDFEGDVVLLQNGDLLDVQYQRVAEGARHGHFVLQRYDSEGIAQGAPIQVNSVPASGKSSLEIFGVGKGQFVVTWLQDDEQGRAFIRMAQRFDENGSAVGDPIEISDDNTVTAGVLENGLFVVAWSHRGEIQYQMYDEQGAEVGPLQSVKMPAELKISQSMFGGDFWSRVGDIVIAPLNGGGFQLTWTLTNLERFSHDISGGISFENYEEYKSLTVTIDALGNRVGGAEEYLEAEEYRWGGTRYTDRWGDSFHGSRPLATPRDGETYTKLPDGGYLVETDFGVLGSQAIVFETDWDASDPIWIFGEPIQGGTLRASLVFIDQDIDFDSVSYQWLRDGEPIAGATGRSYTPGQADVDASGISVVIRYTDKQGVPTELSAEVGGVENVNDAPLGAPQIIGVAAEGFTLRATAFGLTDEDGITAGSASFQWLRDGQLIEGATGPTFVLTADDLGAEITVVATYTDGYGTVETVESWPSAQVVTTDDLLRGDGADNVIQGTQGDELLRGEAGDDTLSGAGGNDTLQGGDGDDLLEGQGAHDRLEGNDGNDTLRGGWGHDTLWGGAGDDLMEGGTGNNLFNGGAGIDTVTYVNAATSVRIDLQNGDLAYGDAVGDSYIGVEVFFTGDTHDQLRGDAGDNEFHAGGKSDRLYGRAGNDLLFGEAGADAFYGGMGADTMTGGDDAGRRDRYVYFDIRESGVGEGSRDVITDFVSGEDRIELSRLDANTQRIHNQIFTFVGDDVLPGVAGTLGYRHEDGNTIVQADVDGDGLADFEIELTGIMDLTEGDFLL